MSLLIGLIGKKGVGKSTASEYIKQTYKANVYSLSTPIKKIAQIFGFPYISIYGNQIEKEKITDMGISGREFLQKIGTEFGREIFPKLFPTFKLEYNNVWIHILHNEFCNHTNTLYILDDIRFQDEANYIKKNKGFLIKITKNALNPILNDMHKSEIEQNNIISDYVINNDGTISDFKVKIDEIIKTLI